MMNASKQWWEKPFRILDYNYLTEIHSYDFNRYVQTCKELHANVVHFHPADVTNGGLKDDSCFFKKRGALNQNRDILAEALPLLKSAGIKLVTYVDGHWYPKNLVEQHPDWQVITHDGSRVENLYGDDDAPACVNTSWREYIFDFIDDLLEYDIDGIFWDGPLSFLGRNACYCESCKAKYKQKYGNQMPTPDRSNPDAWAMLKEFTIDSLCDFYETAYKHIKSKKPNIAIYCNAANVGEPSWIVGRLNRRLMPYQDILISEGGFVYGRINKVKLKTTASSKLYETQASGKPCANAVSPAFGSWRPHHISKPEMSIILAEASFGSNPYAAMWLESGKTPAYYAIADVYGFLENNQAYYEETSSAANIAILYSQTTVDSYSGLDIPYTDISGIKSKPSSAIGNFTRSFEGFQEMLVRLRAPFDVIEEGVLEAGGLSKYDVLIMPNCACMSKKHCDVVREFVANGGKVVSDFETSHLDEKGKRRDNLELSDLFGLDSRNEIYGFRRWDFVHLCDKIGVIANHLTQTFIPAPHYNLLVKPTTGEVKAVFGKPLITNITKTYEPSEDAFLVVNQFGKGKSYYFPCNVAHMFADTQIESYLQLLKGIISAEIILPVAVSGPPHFINVGYRKQGDNRHILQLVNYEVNPISEVIPANNVCIRLAIAHQVKSVRALRLSQELECVASDSHVEFTLPTLNEFEVIIVDTR